MEDHAGIAFLGWMLRDVTVAETDHAGVWRLKSRDHAEERGLATAGRAKQEEQGPGFDPEINAGHRDGGTEFLHEVDD